MKINNQVPFYSNTKDNTHCFQACLRMLLKFYFPDEEYSWEELDQISDKEEDKWTWPMAGMIFLQSKGLAVGAIEEFDYSIFHEQGADYLIERYGEEAGRISVEKSNIEKARAIMPEFLEKVDVENRVADFEEIINFLKNDHLLICRVNSRILNNETGYAGHFVVVKGVDGQELIVHDPGQPAKENRIVDFERFDRAWSSPGKNSRELKTFRLPK